MYCIVLNRMVCLWHPLHISFRLLFRNVYFVIRSKPSFDVAPSGHGAWARRWIRCQRPDDDLDRRHICRWRLLLRYVAASSAVVSNATMDSGSPDGRVCCKEHRCKFIQNPCPTRHLLRAVHSRYIVLWLPGMLACVLSNPL